MDRAQFLKKIDHTILRPDAPVSVVRETIATARRLDVASVCLNPAYVAMAADMLAGTSVAVCTVIGFPLGATSTYAKGAECANAYLHGATEMDMVINIGALKSGNLAFVKSDIEAVVDASPALVKVILENAYLTKEEIALACELAAEAGADFVKTSTGFGPSGATVADVRLMRQSIPAGMCVKAAGGISSLEDALAMLEAGADRLGMSRTEKILAAFDAKFGA